MKENVIVLGMGLSGKAASHFLLSQGCKVLGVDKDYQKLCHHNDIKHLRDKGLTFVEAIPFSSLSNAHYVVISPGIRSDHPLLQAAQKANIPCIGEIELGCRFFANKAVGITGTNGKTTVTQMITHILNHNAKSAKSLGNIGEPLTQELLKKSHSKDIFVIELSSYQLETLYTPCLEAGAILNITPDHLDRYNSMESYAQAKCLISRAIKPTGALFIEENTWKLFGRYLKDCNVKLFGYNPSLDVYTDGVTVFLSGRPVFLLPENLSHKKSHDIENLLAAFALCSLYGISGQQFITHWNTFKKPPHRIEFFAQRRGVSFYDDSKGTNIDATLRAVESLKGDVYLIAGGVDKGFPYISWIEGFKKKVKHVFAIGQSAEKIKKDLHPYIPVTLCSSLEEATKEAMDMAQKGDNVLLSPGCASFDMFRDYAHRGEEFQRIVKTKLVEFEERLK